MSIIIPVKRPLQHCLMKQYIIFLFAVILISGCATTTPLQVQVTPLGEEPAEVKEQYIYTLPETVLKVEVMVNLTKTIPGPYWEYAEKYLGIKDVVTQKSNRWEISHVTVTAHNELDPQQVYSLNVIDGAYNPDFLDPFIKMGLIIDGAGTVHETLDGTGRLDLGEWKPYTDLGVYPNFEERKETMFKTIVTDTGFVQVPVQRSVVEQKSVSRKAQEAADFLLELRLRRFDMLTGEYEVFPDGEAMAAAIQKLDQLEASYLSLFTGKSITASARRSWFIVPRSGSALSRYPLGLFSGQLGFVPEELNEGDPLEVRIEPLGKTESLKIPGSSPAGNSSVNRLFYRMPDVASLKVILGGEVLSEERISIFQSGSLVGTSIN